MQGRPRPPLAGLIAEAWAKDPPPARQGGDEWKEGNKRWAARAPSLPFPSQAAGAGAPEISPQPVLLFTSTTACLGGGHHAHTEG